MLTSYHNHTNWSDGVCSLEDQIEGARNAGIDELGISDHYILHPGGSHIDWSMRVERLPEYIATIREKAAQTEQPILRLGIEADYFPETIDQLRRNLDGQPFDYVIGSVHYLDGFCVDEHVKHWSALSEEEVNDKWRQYWKHMRAMAESQVFDLAAHFDLPKIFGYRPTANLHREACEVLDAMADSNMAIEINTRGWARPCNECYPSPELLLEACKRKIPLSINADAHRPDELKRDFDRARDLARESGYTSLTQFVSRQKREVPL